MDYRIGKRERTNFIDQRGHAVDGYRVFYTMADGTVDYVEIEKAQFSAAAVKKAIEDEIKVHQELMA
ncbi:MAG: hypothetical protein KKB38_20740 [Gammaproteobacteria bacterium]|nr:hypothetical protein [Gammaproteobacteria bacterium]